MKILRIGQNRDGLSWSKDSFNQVIQFLEDRSDSSCLYEKRGVSIGGRHMRGGYGLRKEATGEGAVGGESPARRRAQYELKNTLSNH